MENKLIHHLRSSPMYMPRSPNKDEKSVAKAINENNSIFFIAKHKNKPIGFLEINDKGKNFACDASDMKNICGAYHMPEHR